MANNDLMNAEDAEYRDITGEFSEESNQSKGLDDWMNELGTDVNAEIRVFRDVGGGNTTKEYLFTFEPHDMTMVQLCDKLRDEYGGGDFRVMAYASSTNRSGKSLKFNKSMRTAKPKTQVFEQKPASEMSDVLTVMMQQAQEQREMMQQLIQTMNDRPQAQPLNILELVQTGVPLLAGLKKLFGTTATDPFESAKNIISMMKDLDLSGGGSEKNNADVLLEGIKTLGPVLAGAAQQSMHGSAPQQVRPNPAARVARKYPPMNNAKAGPDASPDLPLKQHKEKGRETLQTRILNDLKNMVKAANRNSDPGLYADLLIDQYSEDEIAQVVNNPQLMDMAAAIVPGMAQQRPWFNQVFAALADYINGDEGGDEFMEEGHVVGDVLTTEADKGINSNHETATSNDNAKGDARPKSPPDVS